MRESGSGDDDQVGLQYLSDDQPEVQVVDSLKDFSGTENVGEIEVLEGDDLDAERVAETLDEGRGENEIVRLG